MYTSGSTGEPKGVVQTHRNVIYYVDNYIKRLSISEKDRLTLFSSYCHDAAVMDIYGDLFSGATLFPLNLIKEDNLKTIPDWIRKNNITIWHSVPTLFRYFANIINKTISLTTMRLIVLGGEAVLKYDIDNFKEKFPDVVLCNLYGQTEASFNSAQFIVNDSEIDEITLGDTIENTEILVLDHSGNRVKEFETGEIVIASLGISPGYWKNNAVTEKAFVNIEGLGRVYITGDLGELLPDNRIRFVGRRDFQVKIRGLRVELGEIETCLLKHDDVIEAAVLSKNNNNFEDYLCAYIICEKYLSEKEIKGDNSYLLSIIWRSLY
ncbi:UNVERIFIED_CONTAM: amino acid adenylation domain-containing protein [Acetivibrio alkalicellulosi]